MRHFYRFLILSCLLFSASANALQFFADGLYWQTTETVDWVHNNNLSTSNQAITFKTFSFNPAPGFRIGAGYQSDWDTKLYYTKYYNSTNASASGHLKSAFQGAVFTLPGGGFLFDTASASLAIDYNMIDWDFGKRFEITKALALHPVVGFRGGWINQTIHSNLQSPTFSIVELIKHNFTGIGPKAGIETTLALLQGKDYQLGLAADFAAAYLWGHWTFSDKDLNYPFSSYVSSRNFGSLAIQALLGASLEYNRLSVKLGYEINDWFNQFQLLDDDTGGINADLILQGLTLNISYDF